MWGFTEQHWQDEIRKSLKEGMSADFKKNLFNGQSIDPFSSLVEDVLLQAGVAERSPFISIQNYSELKSAGLDEWINNPDVGFRFRELNDLISHHPGGRSYSAFLSQPFPFELSVEQQKFLESLIANNSSVNLGWSPLSFGLTRGEILKKPFAGWEKIFSPAVMADKNVSWFYLSSAPYEWGGAEPHMELAILLSLASSILHELESLKVSPQLAASKIHFGLSLGTDVLVESSKLVAIKLLWARLTEMLGLDPVNAPIYGLPSLRVFSGRDPWNNIMRLTLMSFSALVGGAHGFKCIPYDVLNKRKTADAVRVTTNIPLILKQEGYLNLVKNPLDGGSLFSSTLDKLCRSAWQIFQEIERKGGVFEAVRTGWLQTELKRSAEYSSNQMSYLQKELIGINRFTTKTPSYGSEGDIIRLSDIIDPLFLSHTADDYLPVEPLVVSSLSYDWEALQMASDKKHQQSQKRAFLTVVKGGGPVVEKKLHWLNSVLSLGGVDVRVATADTLSTTKDISSLVIVLPSGEDMELALSASLKSLGIEKVWVMDHAKKDPNVDRYFDAQINALEFVKDVHHFVVESR